MNTRKGPRRQPSSGSDPPCTPDEVLVRPSPRSSSVSELSAPSSSRRRSDKNLLAGIATNDVMSPPRSRGSRDPPADRVPTDCYFVDAMEEEESHDRREYNENAGASDSEDEDDDDNQLLLEVMDERNSTMEGNSAATINETDFVVSHEATSNNASSIWGAPANWTPPSAPADWNEPAAVRNLPVPKFENVDNPGGWSNFAYQPKYKREKGGKVTAYLYHALPTGAPPVPLTNGTRCHGGWTFHYKGWRIEDNVPKYQSGATKENPFPECQKGCLDIDILQKLGLDAERMMEDDKAPDALWFHQLLMPICARLPIPDDPHTFFHSQVSQWSNLCAIGELNLGSGTNHHCVNANPQELVHWDGVLTKDGALGGSRGAILRRFDQSRDDNSAFDIDIANSITKTRWLELKRVHKLCNNSTAKKRGQSGYDPAYKYRFIYDVLASNVNALTKCAGLDLCGDESTWPFNGCGEAKTGILQLVIGKPGVTKGGQVTMLSDVDRIRPRAFLHRHKLHQFEWGLQGPSEVRLMWEKYIKPIGDCLLEYAAKEGFGLTLTRRRDRLPKAVPGKYLCKEKTNSTARPKAVHFENPIFMTKKVGKSTLQFTSFQSTSSCNFAHVNAINECELFAQAKERGRGPHKRSWGIEMNQSCQLYLASYGKIDTIDHLIQHCDMFYRSWKYWHSPCTHAKAMAIVVAHDIYLEVCEGKLNSNYKIEKPVSFHRFCEKLAKQQLKYDPRHRKYPGDEFF